MFGYRYYHVNEVELFTYSRRCDEGSNDVTVSASGTTVLMRLCVQCKKKIYTLLQEQGLFLSSITYLLPVANHSTRMHAYTHTHMRTHTRTRTHTHTHTHTHTQRKVVILIVYMMREKPSKSDVALHLSK